MKKIVVIGGGTGTYTVLSGLRDKNVSLSAVVSMMDSGGSNRVLRDEFGILPTSDLRQCIIALADQSKNKLLRDLFNYRFSQGVGISGMTFGNLFMAALTDMYGSQKKAIEATCRIFEIKGSIAPVTYYKTHLVARYENGKQVLGEHFIDEPNEFNGNISELHTIPEASISSEAKAQILSADVIVLGPGDLFTSLIANLVVDGVVQAINGSKAKIIYISNLMTKYGQTSGFKTSDHIKTLSKFLGKKPDFVLVQKAFKLSPELKKRYKLEKAEIVQNDTQSDPDTKIILGNFLSGKIIEKNKADKLKRSIVRHDPNKLAEAIMKIL